MDLYWTEFPINNFYLYAFTFVVVFANTESIFYTWTNETLGRRMIPII